MRNKFAGKCYKCGGKVKEGDGFFERHNRAWRVQHADCKKQTIGYKKLSKAAAQTTKPYDAESHA